MEVPIPREKPFEFSFELLGLWDVSTVDVFLVWWTVTPKVIPKIACCNFMMHFLFDRWPVITFLY